MSMLRSLLFYLVFYGLSAPFVIAALLALLLSEEALRKVADNWSAFHRFCVERVLGIRVRVEGERPPGPVLYAIKHESFFEAIDVAQLLDRPVVFAKEELFRIPLWGRAARAYGTISVARGDGARALRYMLSEAKRYSATGRPLVIFPEGTRVPHGTVPPLRSGFAGLYKLLGMQVVPVAVDSGPAYHSFRKGGGTITIRFCEPIPAGLPREEAEVRVRMAINQLNAADRQGDQAPPP